MYKENKIQILRAISPIHAGSGQDLGIVDMPIQREKHSNIPKIEGSSLKGAIKHHIYHLSDDNAGRERLKRIFGDDDGSLASRISITDAKLLFFSIKATKNIYALITCPYILKRFANDIKNSDLSKKINKLIESSPSEGECISNTSDKSIILEEYMFSNTLREIDMLKNKEDNDRIVLVNNQDFIDLVTMYTEIITRNKIVPKTGITSETGLFTEEYLPTESILYFNFLVSPVFDNSNDEKKLKEESIEDIFKYFDEDNKNVFQVGGNKTIGKGFVNKLNVEDIFND